MQIKHPMIPSVMSVTCALFLFIITISSCADASSKQIHKMTSWQNQLLGMASDVAAQIPVDPHVKDRSRTQEQIVQACLQLNSPSQAQQVITDIKNWRQYLCQADLANYWAQNNQSQKAQHLIIEIENNITSENIDRQWRRDRIRAKIAQIQKKLGHTAQVQNTQSKLESDHFAQVNDALQQATQDDFETQINALTKIVKTNNFDLVQFALTSYVQLYAQYYEDTSRRDIIEDHLANSWQKIPGFVRLERLLDMSQIALDHKDAPQAISLINQASNILTNAQWPIEDQIKRSAAIIMHRIQAGDNQTAQTHADQLLQLYKQNENRIINIYRAAALRPLAQTYQALGNTNQALAVYKMALDAGIQNPNSRPRAQDLAATCCSMAVAGVKPDRKIMKKIETIREGLGQPW